MILKRKIIFGTIGFLVASGAITLTIILATSDDKSPIKAKTKLDVPKLTSNSFEVSGTQTLGIVNLKDDSNLNEQIQLKYFVGSEAPINDKDYATNKPSTLKNSDIVYIKPFIKKASIASYEFKDKAINPIKFVVSDLPLTTISNSLLIKDSFIVSGTQTQGTVKKKPNVIFPNQIEAKYFKGASAPNQDNAYETTTPNNLSNNDKVHIKFFVKKEHIATHKFADNFINLITILIDTLPKIEVDSSLLASESFLISGSESQGVIEKKAEIALPSEIETKYFKGASAPNQDSAYETTIPNSLSNNDIVHIKFFIKSKYIATHKFANSFVNSISIPIKGLKTLIDYRALKTSSFEFINEPSKTIRWRSGVIFPEQLVIKYYKSLSNTRPIIDNDYETNAPTNLNEGDHIYIKFFIKAEHKNTHKFSNRFENFIHIEVKNDNFKSIINILNLKTSSFQTSGNNGKGILQWNDKMNLPNEVEIRYAKSKNEPISDSAYSSIAPTNLSNNDIIYIKFFINDSFTTTHEFPISGFTNPIPFRISGLKTLIDHRTLQKSSFEVSGNQGKGKIGWRTNARAPILPSQVEIRYYKGSVKPIIDSSYKNTPLLALSNNDQVHIKFFIKEDHIKTYEFASNFDNYILFVVSGLSKNEVEVASLVSSSFKAIGIPGAGIIKLKDSVSLPKEVEVKYARAGSKPSSDGKYSSTMPTNLNNGDNVHIKFFIKDIFKASYKLPTSGFANYILFVVKDLKTPILNNGKNVLQDSSGNIWAMGKGAPLQVLKKEDVGFANSWINNTIQEALLNGSNITDGENGVIFEDSSGNIWAMGKGTSLQVLKRTSTGFANLWINSRIETGLLKGSNITDGENGVIFEDSSGNIWAMGKGTSLQVLKRTSTGFANLWINSRIETGLLKGSNITDGENGVIFEDSSGNIWAMGKGTSLQVLKRTSTGFANLWINSRTETGLLKDSNITNGEGGVIFEDSSGNIWAMGKGTPLQVLKRTSTGFANLWINSRTETGLLKGSNINYGFNGTIFEDSNGNIWAMGLGTPLQVLKKEGGIFANSWTNDTSSGLLKNSNITDGENGVIFEDSSGNIWAMGKGTPLQALKKEGGSFADSWINDSTQPGLLKNSNITNGEGGVIFEDSSGNIWAMGLGTPLQILKKEGDSFVSSWTIVTSRWFILNDSSITDGQFGAIFQDSSGNIWAMGYSSPLQVLKKTSTGFANSWISGRTKPGLLNGSKIVRGARGVIFEDSNGNIWAMAHTSPLQVLKKTNTGFANSWVSSKTEPGLLKGSNIKYGFNGTVFEDSNGNIWAMGYGTPLQVLKKEGASFANSWTDDISSGLLKGSNITDGNGGIIFEDSSGNIWAMGKETPLQVLKKEGDNFANSWINNTTEPGLLNGSNITNGYSGTILEDSLGNLWAMGAGTPLQVLKKEGSSFASSWTSNTSSELLSGSIITNGWDGTIFNDSSGNIWAMGHNSPLQVLIKNVDGTYADSWINDSTREGLLKNSNISYGKNGVIFEDSSGNIWAMGYKKPLQVLRKEGGSFASSWTDDTSSGLLKSSNITDGEGGVIFQDSSGRIWAIGNGTPLQVLRKANGGFA